MKALYKNLKYFCIVLVMLGGLLVSCAELDVPSPTVRSDSEMFANESTLMLYLSRLYSQMPFEDIRFGHQSPYNDDWLMIPDQASGQLHNRDRQGFMTSEGGDREPAYWVKGFQLIRDANVLLETIEEYKSNFSESFYNHCKGEAYFTRAMVFYKLAQRYGGIPIVTKVLKYPEFSAAELEIPRSTEAESWDQVLEDFNSAIEFLNDASPRRGLANKYVALGFKSEAMLYAGSVAKYNGTTNTGFGRKTNVRVIGFDPATSATLSKKYFLEAYNAAREVMKANKYSLYKKAWSAGNRQAQYQNMVDMFFDIDSPENMYIKEYALGYLVHGFDVYAYPLQLRSAGYSCEATPILDFVELYDGLPKNPDGTTKVFDKEPNDPDRKYVFYDQPMDFFKDAEPRLRAYVVFPMDQLLGVTIDIRRGVFTGDVTNGIAPLMKQDGIEIYNTVPSPNYNTVDAFQGRGEFGEQVLYVCQNGADNIRTSVAIKWSNGRDTIIHASGESGPFTNNTGANGGFSLRKWIDPNKPVGSAREGQCLQHFVLMRYAEILLNAAEAACELAIAGESAPSGDNFAEIATNAIRDIRERAGADPLPGTLTLNEDTKMLIRRERQKELAYENKNLWDIRRWRTQHSDIVNGSTATDGIYYRGLYPFYSSQAGKYFFDVRFEEHNWRYRLGENDYYLAIPSGEVSKSPVIDQQPFR